MKALVLEEVGAAPTYRDFDPPALQPGEARVRIRSAALNHRDVWIYHGKYPGIVTPIVLGSDGCGVVEEVCEGDQTWVDQEVLINPSLDWGDNPAHQSSDFSILGLPRHGTFAETITIPILNLKAKPSHLDATVAGALPLAGMTAWRALMTRAQLRSEEAVLVSGIGGGVALFAMQFALASGAEVFVTSSSPEKITRAKEMGAKDGILYTETDWRKSAQALRPSGFDVIIDGAGGDGFADLARLLGPGGRLAFYGGTCGKWPPILPQHLFYKQVSILATTMGSPGDFEGMVDFVDEHNIEPVVDRTFSLSDGAAAFAHLDSGAQFGKVVLTT